jgi:hypothetical protein
MFEKSPKLYEQLARDSVVASRRLERGVSMFEESTLDSIDEQDINISEQGSIVLQVPKTMDLSFDKYYQDWLLTGTGLESRKTLKRPIRVHKLLRKKTLHTKQGMYFISKTIAEYIKF